MSDNGTESLPERTPACVDEQHGGTNPANTPPSESSNPSEPRRQQLRSRFAGVSQATKKGLGSAGQLTKNRFGAAIQVAKQKGKQAVDKRRNQVQIQSNNDDETVVSLSTSLLLEHQWPCPSCSFLNSATNEECALCECSRPGKADDIDDSNDFEPVSAESQSEANATLLQNTTGSLSLEQDPEISAGQDLNVSGRADGFYSDSVDGYGDDVPESGGKRLGVKQRLGAAVLRARTARSERKSYRSASEDTPAGAPDPVTLRNMYVGSPLPTPVHPFGHSCFGLQDIPLKRLAGLWFVKVKMESLTPKEGPLIPHSDVSPEGETLLPQPVNCPSSESVGASGDDQDGKADSPNTLLGQRVPDDATRNLKESTDVNDVTEKTFRIDVYHRQEKAASKVASLVRRMPDIVHLHTSLSQSLTKVPLYMFDVDDDKEPAYADIDSELSIYVGLTTIDKVRLTGKFLGSLLERPAAPSDKFHSNWTYQGMSVAMYF